MIIAYKWSDAAPWSAMPKMSRNAVSRWLVCGRWTAYKRIVNGVEEVVART